MEVCASTEMDAPSASHLGMGDHGPKTDRSRPRSVPVNALAMLKRWVTTSRLRGTDPHVEIWITSGWPLVQNRWISLATKYLHVRSRSYGRRREGQRKSPMASRGLRNHPAADFAYHMESVACGPESSTRPIENYNPISLRGASPMT
jgi:hypothetical protein